LNAAIILARAFVGGGEAGEEVLETTAEGPNIPSRSFAGAEDADAAVVAVSSSPKKSIKLSFGLYSSY
jgi:hypothetical protein